MPITAVPNTITPQSQTAQQKAETNTEQTEKGRSNTSLENSPSENRFDDSVTLSRTEKVGETSRIADDEEAGKVLSQTVKAIFDDTKAALSAQANTSPQAAQKYLAGN